MTRLCIRSATLQDAPYVLHLNAENVAVLSPMDRERYHYFEQFAEQFLLAELDGQPAGFLIALREGLSAYDSENYLWFSRHYSQFLYIDRIVIDPAFRGRGIGKALYQSVFRCAAAATLPYVTAEIDTIPYNEASLLFHKAMGFREVGTQTVRGGSITVSLQERLVTSLDIF